MLLRNRFCSFSIISVLFNYLFTAVNFSRRSYRNHFIYLHVRNFTLYIKHVIVVDLFFSSIIHSLPLPMGTRMTVVCAFFFLHRLQSTIINLVGLCCIVSFFFCSIQHLPFAMPTVPTITAIARNDIKSLFEYRFFKSRNRKRVEHVKHIFFHYKRERENIRAFQKTNVLRITMYAHKNEDNFTSYVLSHPFFIRNSQSLHRIIHFLYFGHSGLNFTKVSFQFLI